jgi:hypothetical protein
MKSRSTLGKRFQEQCIRGMDDKLKEKIEHMLHCLHNNFPRLALVTFTIPVPIINDSSSSGDLKGHWTAPSLYGRLVTASLRGRWQDQGWGNQKGSLIYHCHDRDTGCLVLAVKGVAPHQEEPFEGVVGPKRLDRPPIHWRNVCLGTWRRGSREERWRRCQRKAAE